MEKFTSWSFFRAAVKGRGGRKPVAKLGWGEGGGRKSCHCFSWDRLCWLRWVRVKQVGNILTPLTHEITSQIACSPSPLVQLAETPDEVVVSKDWRQRASQSFFLFYVKLVRLAAVITSNFLIQWWRSSMGLLVIAIDTVWFEAVENKSDLQTMLIFFA